MYDVVRNFGIDYIYFDVAFLVVFVFFLIRGKHWIPLVAMFVGGIGINFVVDWGIWLHSGIREVVLPFSFLGSQVLFFLWFSFSYGVEYAFVFLLFARPKHWLRWTFGILIGWLAVATLSQLLSWNDATITTIRHMSDLRWVRFVFLLVGYGLLIILRYDMKTIVFLFAIGFVIHFMMESVLWLTHIRPGSMGVLIENSLVEFTMGVPFFFLLYDRVIKKRLVDHAH